MELIFAVACAIYHKNRTDYLTASVLRCANLDWYTEVPANVGVRLTPSHGEQQLVKCSHALLLRTLINIGTWVTSVFCPSSFKKKASVQFHDQPLGIEEALLQMQEVKF